MPTTFHDIAGFPAPPPGSRHAAVSTPGRIVHLAGQTGTDPSGELVPGGLAAQFERALRNVALALEAAGARPEHVVKSTFYVVGWEPSMIEELMRGAAAARAEIPFPDVPVTLIGVQSLFTPDMLVEVESVAVID